MDRSDFYALSCTFYDCAVSTEEFSEALQKASALFTIDPQEEQELIRMIETMTRFQKWRIIRKIRKASKRRQKK